MAIPDQPPQTNLDLFPMASVSYKGVTLLGLTLGTSEMSSGMFGL